MKQGRRINCFLNFLTDAHTRCPHDFVMSVLLIIKIFIFLFSQISMTPLV